MLWYFIKHTDNFNSNLNYNKLIKLYIRRQCTYKCNVEERSRNHCCSGKEINITYSECVFVALGIQDAMGIRHIFICVLSGSTIFSYIIS